MGRSKTNRYIVPNFSKQEDRIDSGLEQLELSGILASYKNIAERIIKQKGTPHDFLESLIEKEILLKEENRVTHWTQQARFPWKKTLKDFDFSFQPTIDERQIYELASCRFIDKAKNIMFLGPAGVGKTHLSIALGLEAIQKGCEVRFFTLSQLIEQVKKHVERERLHLLLGALTRLKLLILDEMDLYEVDKTTSEFLSRLLYQRYEKGAIIFTSNRPFEQWNELFGNRTRASIIIDRITHHCIIIHIQGESYRVKDKLSQLDKNTQ